MDKSKASTISTDGGQSPESSHKRPRPERSRGPKRKAKKIERARQHHERWGLPWEEQDIQAPALSGSAASSVHEAMLKDKKDEAIPTQEDRVQHIEDALVKEIPVEMRKWVQMVNGKPRCLICKKDATAGHLHLIEHVKKIEEYCLRTQLAGEADTNRRFNGDLCTGVATKKKVKGFWGDALENLPFEAMRIHRKKRRVPLWKKRRAPSR